MLRSRLTVPGRSAARHRATTGATSPVREHTVSIATGTETAAPSPTTSAPTAPDNSRETFETRLARLEGGVGAVAFDSPASARRALARAVADERTAIAWAETLKPNRREPVDVPGLALAAHREGDRLVVDNTLAPGLIRPLALGADAVIHSSLAPLEGHGDTIGAAVVTRDPALAARIRDHRDAAGSALQPFAGWLVSMGLDTLRIRMARAGTSARAIAQMLSLNRRLGSVRYPGVGACLAVDFSTGEAAAGFADATRLFLRAGALGGVASQVRVDPDGSGTTTVRLYAGIEETADLQADVAAALDRAMARLARLGPGTRAVSAMTA